MTTTTFKPSWWNEQEHGTAWGRVKAAMRRDWEQTKNDFTPGAPDLGQDVDDTIKQAAGKDPIPAAGQATPGTLKQSAYLEWDEVEAPLAYGYAARTHYRARYPQWNDQLETELKSEWNKSKASQKWDDVKDTVRRGFHSTY
jgi:hypothetical protein